MDSLAPSGSVHRLVCDAAVGLREICESLASGPLPHPEELVVVQRLEVAASAVVEALRAAALAAAEQSAGPGRRAPPVP